MVSEASSSRAPDSSTLEAVDKTPRVKRAAPAGTGGRPRTPWGSISRDQIVSAAVKALRDGGYDQMTIRGLAAELGVAPMSLYRHIRDKDDILDEVVEHLLAEVWRPSADPSDWRAWISEAADRLRQFLVSEPAALHVYLTHPVVSASAIARMESMIEVLRQALPDEEAARRAYAAIQTYTVGFAALEASRAGWNPSGAEVSDLAKQLAAFTTPRQFATGFSYLLSGIEQMP